MQEGTVVEFKEFVDSLECSGDEAEHLAELLLRSFVSHREPETTVHIELITLHSSGRGVSRKPGNFTLNWRRLFDNVPDIAIASVGGVASGAFVRGLIGLYVWNKVWRSMEEDIDEAEASIIESLWIGGAKDRDVSESDAFQLTNATRERRGLPHLDQRAFTIGVNRLVELQCLKLKDGNLWLREWVSRRV